MAMFISNYVHQISLYVMIPNDLGSLSSALEKILGNQGVVDFVIECSDDHHVTLMLHIQGHLTMCQIAKHRT